MDKKAISHPSLESSTSTRFVVAVDVAKEKMFAAVMDAEEDEVLVTVKWSHPVQSEAFYRFVALLHSKRPVEVVMEPTETYGDDLRFHLLERNSPVYHASPNLAHNASELYDVVPSSHDGTQTSRIDLEKKR